MSLWSRIAGAVRDRLARKIDEEIEAHIEAAVTQSRDPSEALRA